MRALPALNQPPESYGALLTSVILNKLAPETKTNMARDHYDSQWTIDELLTSIQREIRIFEAGQQSTHRHNSHTNSTPTTGSFHTATNHNRGASHEKSKKNSSCIFCKGPHKPGSCNTITCHKERLAIVKSAGLCFNCLARHKVSQCTSRFTCKECHRKHHTSLCHAFTMTNRPPQPPSTTRQEQTASTTTTTDQATPTNSNHCITISITHKCLPIEDCHSSCIKRIHHSRRSYSLQRRCSTFVYHAGPC